MFCRNESELIEKIVKDTLDKLAPAPVQMNHKEVKSVLDTVSNDTVQMMGSYGAGGIGKTTFAVGSLSGKKKNEKKKKNKKKKKNAHKWF
ncbi:resistance protein [Trifolium medium]|uniref:Resistance protein n=1 Tax=Trifolium medium TaxID=97028 RepID=A0A392QLC3_9FABA|nr:resistance protein [Trifolium medium]